MAIGNKVNATRCAVQLSLSRLSHIVNCEYGQHKINSTNSFTLRVSTFSCPYSIHSDFIWLHNREIVIRSPVTSSPKHFQFGAILFRQISINKMQNGTAVETVDRIRHRKMKLHRQWKLIIIKMKRYEFKSVKWNPSRRKKLKLRFNYLASNYIHVGIGSKNLWNLHGRRHVTTMQHKNRLRT